MSQKPIVVEQLYDAPISAVWDAITQKEQMKEWYFDLEDFQAVNGFTFQFTGGPQDGIQYLHLCEVTEVIPRKKLTYSWRYDGYDGISYVTFELFEKNNQTLLRLTHEGIETFPKDNPDLHVNNFEKGWNEIIHQNLRKFFEDKKPVK